MTRKMDFKRIVQQRKNYLLYALALGFPSYGFAAKPSEQMIPVIKEPNFGNKIFDSLKSVFEMNREELIHEFELLKDKQDPKRTEELCTVCGEMSFSGGTG